MLLLEIRLLSIAGYLPHLQHCADCDGALPEGPVMGGQPRFTIFGAITDHTTHHRGALTVYSRLRGHVPAMPYM